jgi:hypothetical protein
VEPDATEFTLHRRLQVGKRIKDTWLSAGQNVRTRFQHDQVNLESGQAIEELFQVGPVPTTQSITGTNPASP